MQPEIQRGVMVKARPRRGRGSKGWVPAKVLQRDGDRVSILFKGRHDPTWFDLRDRQVVFWTSRNPTAVLPDIHEDLASRGLDDGYPVISKPVESTLDQAPPPPSPPPPSPPPPEHPVTTRQKNQLTFEDKLAIVDRIAAIREEGTPLPMSAITARLVADLPQFKGFLVGIQNLERLLKATKFPDSLVLPEPTSLVKGSEIQVALAALGTRLSRIERELGLS